MWLARILTTGILVLGTLTLWFSAWKRVPESKKDQRPYMYIGAIASTITTVLLVIAWY